MTTERWEGDLALMSPSPDKLSTLDKHFIFQVRKNDFIYHIKASNMFSLFESIDPDSHSRWQTLAGLDFFQYRYKINMFQYFLNGTISTIIIYHSNINSVIESTFRIEELFLVLFNVKLLNWIYCHLTDSSCHERNQVPPLFMSPPSSQYLFGLNDCSSGFQVIWHKLWRIHWQERIQVDDNLSQDQ